MTILIAGIQIESSVQICCWLCSFSLFNVLVNNGATVGIRLNKQIQFAQQSYIFASFTIECAFDFKKRTPCTLPLDPPLNTVKILFSVVMRFVSNDIIITEIHFTFWSLSHYKTHYKGERRFVRWIFDNNWFLLETHYNWLQFFEVWAFLRKCLLF